MRWSGPSNMASSSGVEVDVSRGSEPSLRLVAAARPLLNMRPRPNLVFLRGAVLGSEEAVLAPPLPRLVLSGSVVLESPESSSRLLLLLVLVPPIEPKMPPEADTAKTALCAWPRGSNNQYCPYCWLTSSMFSGVTEP